MPSFLSFRVASQRALVCVLNASARVRIYKYVCLRAPDVSVSFFLSLSFFFTEQKVDDGSDSRPHIYRVHALGSERPLRRRAVFLFAMNIYARARGRRLA